MKRTQENVATRRIDTVIGKDTTVKGRIDAEGSLRIDGKYEGEIVTAGDLVVGETGMVSANIEAKNISIAGEVRGNVVARGKLELIPTGRLYGDVKMAVLVVEDGAVFHGQCEMFSPEGDLRERGKSFQIKTPEGAKEAASAKADQA